MTNHLVVMDARPEAAGRRSAAAVVGNLQAEPGHIQEEVGATATVAALARVRVAWWYGLGVLWIVDALLQLRPVMLTSIGLVDNALLPAAQGQPGWIAGPMLWDAGIWADHSGAWNAVAVALELLIGCLLFAGRRRPSWGQAGLVLSVVWGLIVWYFGQGLGGLFTGSATYLAAAPGSALLYALLAAALLLPETVWSSPGLLAILRIGGGAL